MECYYEPPSLQSLALATVMHCLEEDNAETRTRNFECEGLYTPQIKTNLQHLQALTGQYLVKAVVCDVKCSHGRTPNEVDWIKGFISTSKVAMGDEFDVSLNMTRDPHFFLYLFSTEDHGVHVEANFFQNFEVEETLNPHEIKFKQSVMDDNSVKIIKWFTVKPKKNEKIENWSYIKTSLKLMNPSDTLPTLLWKKDIYLHKSCTRNFYDTLISWECRAIKVCDDVKRDVKLLYS